MMDELALKFSTKSQASAEVTVMKFNSPRIVSEASRHIMKSWRDHSFLSRMTKIYPRKKSRTSRGTPRLPTALICKGHPSKNACLQKRKSCQTQRTGTKTTSWQSKQRIGLAMAMTTRILICFHPISFMKAFATIRMLSHLDLSANSISSQTKLNAKESSSRGSSRGTHSQRTNLKQEASRAK